MFSVLTKLLGNPNSRYLKRLKPMVGRINSLEDEFAKKSDAELKALKPIFIQRLKNGENILPEAFATVREAAKRTLGQRHFDVQLMGGIVLNEGKIAEMKTGEGKTLVSTLSAYLNALQQKGVHIITVNDYLAKRDSEWMGRIFRFLGLTVGCITQGDDSPHRRLAYAADITYVTNNEIGFDYLRDNMTLNADHRVIRNFSYAIIDEVDSILIDEARTPLIISGRNESSSELYIRVDKLIPSLKPQDFEKDDKAKNVTLTEQGSRNIEQMLQKEGVLRGGLYDVNNVAVYHHVNQALKAHTLFRRDVDYIVKEGRVVIIDEFTGRMMEGRRYSEGLHQALEAKERVPIQFENQTLAGITFQNFFRLYDKLAGMTGTAATEASEFNAIYGLGVVSVPTNKELIRTDENDEIWRTAAAKLNAVCDLIAECRKRDQPVLVGTVSIEKSEMMSAMLSRRNIPHGVLNARNHEKEATIIAQAGVPGTVTIATNMAGRGTDIQLGGNPEMRIAQELGDEPNQSQATAIRSETERLKQKTIAAGGLFVIATERHESRRIDNQLRGRSGRQGDPGRSRFFLSLEDDLMRIFGGTKLDAMMKRLGLKDDEAIIHSWVNKAIQKAQQRVEAHNFEIRRNLLRFDDVMNDQRKAIYDQRNFILDKSEPFELTDDLRRDSIARMIAATTDEKQLSEQWDAKAIHTQTLALTALDLPISNWLGEPQLTPMGLRERILKAADEANGERRRQIGDELAIALEKNILLRILDQLWRDHLLNLDHLRQGINLRAYGQRDPLNEYKREAFEMFQQLLLRLGEEVTGILSHVRVERRVDSEEIAEKPTDVKLGRSDQLGMSPFAQVSRGGEQEAERGDGKETPPQSRRERRARDRDGKSRDGKSRDGKTHDGKTRYGKKLKLGRV